MEAKEHKRKTMIIIIIALIFTIMLAIEALSINKIFINMKLLFLLTIGFGTLAIIRTIIHYKKYNFGGVQN